MSESGTSPTPETANKVRGVSGLLGGYSPLRRAWRRYRPRWLWQLTPMGSRIAPFVAKHGTSVRRGPFEGMIYPMSLVGHANTLAAKLMGAYETELSESIGELIELRFDQIANIGAGEGYYSVGLARAMPRVTVHAFETDGGERRRCRELALANGVADQVKIHGTCDIAALEKVTRGSTLVICDCEGCERELLRPDLVSGLLDATVLVELHPLIDSSIPDTVLARFAPTHAIRRLHSEPRDPADWAEVAGLNGDDAALLLSESGLVHEAPGGSARASEWALMSPRATTADSATQKPSA